MHGNYRTSVTRDKGLQVADWLKRRAGIVYTVGGFTTRAAVMSFSVKVTVLVVVIANILNFVAHVLINAAGYLPYPVAPAIVVGAVITTLLAGVLTFAVTFINASAIRQLSISHDIFEQMSRIDALSGLLNRRAFLDAIESEASETSLVLFDVDRFKAVNDTYGHEAGDRVIVAVAKVLSDTIPKSNVVARIGGEEFAVLLIGRTRVERLSMVEHVRQSLQNQPILLDEATINVTVSAGVAERSDYQSYSQLFGAADRALYIAKAFGRNRAVHDRDAQFNGKTAVEIASATK